MKLRAKFLTFVGALVGAFVGTLLVPGVGTAVGVIIGIAVGWRFSRAHDAPKGGEPGPVL